MTAKRHHNYHRSRRLPNARPGFGLRLRTDHDAIKARSLWRLLVIVIIASTTHRAPAQVVPTLRMPTRLSAFGTFTDAKPHFQYYDDHAVWGGTLGGFMQLPRFGGLEVRGTVVRFGGLSHQESALIGPRTAVHIFHVTPYGSLLFGEGRSWWWRNPPGRYEPPPKLDHDHGFQWTIVGGVDFHLRNRISFRIGELSYSRLYTPRKNLTPLSASTGIVFRLN